MSIFLEKQFVDFMEKFAQSTDPSRQIADKFLNNLAKNVSTPQKEISTETGEHIYFRDVQDMESFITYLSINQIKYNGINVVIRSPMYPTESEKNLYQTTSDGKIYIYKDGFFAILNSIYDDAKNENNSLLFTAVNKILMQFQALIGIEPVKEQTPEEQKNQDQTIQDQTIQDQTIQDQTNQQTKNKQILNQQTTINPQNVSNQQNDYQDTRNIYQAVAKSLNTRNTTASFVPPYNMATYTFFDVQRIDKFFAQLNDIVQKQQLNELIAKRYNINLNPLASLAPMATQLESQWIGTNPVNKMGFDLPGGGHADLVTFVNQWAGGDAKKGAQILNVATNYTGLANTALQLLATMPFLLEFFPNGRDGIARQIEIGQNFADTFRASINRMAP